MRHATRSPILPLVLLACGVSAAGCGLFEPRDAETPTDVEVDYETPIDPRIALRNIEATTEARFIGNFQRAFTTDYRFRFDPFDAGADTVWTLSRDLQALGSLLQNEVESVDLTWTVRDSGNIGEDRYYRNLGYRLVFRRSATDSVVFGGRCTLYFRTEGVEWLIYRWADVRDETAELTWGYARLNPNLVP
ncbi:MAG: hypothetical protein GF346_10685 [Candidatus Eisenbacteria bacterium]|nr:hypothetical protein [Candidatus Latescibacterota bacterium]MBD3302903.1 hypothetical protein [Candidatus Eisenbacteria bacterium]